MSLFSWGVRKLSISRNPDTSLSKERCPARASVLPVDTGVYYQDQSTASIYWNVLPGPVYSLYILECTARTSVLPVDTGPVPSPEWTKVCATPLTRRMLTVEMLRVAPTFLVRRFSRLGRRTYYYGGP